MSYNLENEFIFLRNDLIFGNKELGIFKKNCRKAVITDFSILLGGHIEDDLFGTKKLDKRTGCWWTDTPSEDGSFYVVDNDFFVSRIANCRDMGVRPVLPFYRIESECMSTYKSSTVKEVLFGEYPQMKEDRQISRDLEIAYNDGDLNITGKNYTTDSVGLYEYDTYFNERRHVEYEYNGKKYIRFIGDENCEGKVLSDGSIVEIGKPYWICVEPITWLVEDKLLAVAKNILFSGIQYETKYGGKFMGSFLARYFSKDIIPSRISVLSNNSNASNLINGTSSDTSKREVEDLNVAIVDNNLSNDAINSNDLKNPYNFDLDKVSEEEIIRGCIESCVPVFLHGASSEGKSARVKQIDPKLIKLSLAGITPEKLNGRSVYNSVKDTMEDKKPTWLERLEGICASEPDKNHILFLDELSNALPSIQGMVYHLVLDREVNDRWYLPDNARIVLAGNEMKDSLAANRIVEPLFNRCAHVYIKTRLADWLIWASDNNIHPSIYSFMVYTNGRALRSEYNGETPNADPRKWEMVSKVLYSTGKPEMIRALVGEEITREFCQFCNQKVITLNDVINGNYNSAYLSKLNTAEKYATVVGLSYVDKDNLEIVRKFVGELGQEFVSVFDSIWCSSNEERIDIITEMKMKGKTKKL